MGVSAPTYTYRTYAQERIVMAIHELPLRCNAGLELFCVSPIFNSKKCGNTFLNCYNYSALRFNPKRGCFATFFYTKRGCSAPSFNFCIDLDNVPLRLSIGAFGVVPDSRNTLLARQ